MAPTTINIMLGTACNWSCSYCLQNKQTGFDKKKDPAEFSERLVDYLKSNNINNLNRICYWGGEPLLYTDYVYTIEESLHNIPTVKPNRVITNGSLIDDQFVSFVNEKQMMVNLSYHEGQLSDQSWAKALQIKRLYITSMISHQNLVWDEFFNKWQYILDKFGRCVNWYIYPMRATPGVPQHYWLTLDDLDFYFDYLDWVVDKAQYNVFYNRMVQILFYSMRKMDYNANNKCYNKHVLSVDLSGNRYFCHHDCSDKNIVYNIFDKPHNDAVPDNVNNMGERCNHCPLYDSCMGGCFRDLNCEVSCQYNLRLYAFLNRIRTKYPNLVPPQYYNMIP